MEFHVPNISQILGIGTFLCKIGPIFKWPPCTFCSEFQASKKSTNDSISRKFTNLFPSVEVRPFLILI